MRSVSSLFLLASSWRLKHTSAFSNKASFSSLISGVANSIMGRGPSDNVSKPALDARLASLDPAIPSIATIQERLRERQTPEERAFRQNLPMGYGVGSPLHKVRLFDESNKEADVRVTFYRDSASWCPYCQKVWIALEEKRIPYRIEKVNMRCYGDKPASFSRMQPSGQIPVAVIDGVVHGQSNDILARLESDDFRDYKSLTAAYKHDDRTEARARELLRLERSVFSAWMYWLTSSPSNKKMFLDAIDQVEDALRAASPGPFFLGSAISMVDIQFAPFLERMAASMVYYKGFVIRVAPGAATDYPNINKWFDAMESLDSYRLTKSDYYTHCWDLPPQLGGCVAEPTGEKFRKAINGERTLDGRRGSWELPLLPNNGGAEPDWSWIGEVEAKREAVERVTANFDAIVRFASRGAGRRGMPSVSAPLADPNAIPNEAVQGPVGVILRLVCTTILEANNDHETTMKSIASGLKEDGGPETVKAVIDSLSYMRDRVGVPRDMRLPAARQLRAHLNWAIGHLL